MYVRVEVATLPEQPDPGAEGILKLLESALPDLHSKIKAVRLLDVYWLEVPVPREDLLPAIAEIFWDPVLQWAFTGGLIPSAAGKTGTLQDISGSWGSFRGIERRFRPGVTDNTGRTVVEAMEIVLGAGKKMPEARAASGSLLAIDAPELSDEDLGEIARQVFCNELIESWTILSADELVRNDRFQQDRVKQDFPRVTIRSSDEVGTYPEVTAPKTTDAELEAMSRDHLWALSLDEMKAVQAHYRDVSVIGARKRLGLGAPTDVELEVIAQTWSEHCKHKIFNAVIDYKDSSKNSPKNSRGAPVGGEIPARVESLFKTTISGTTRELPRDWLLSVFSDNAGIVAFDDEDAFCIKVETHNSPSALDPYGGALTGIVGVNRDILGCGLGSKPIFNTNVFCVAPLNTLPPLPERLLHPRRILEGVRKGVEHGGNKSGIPTINGALCFDERYLGKPLVYCGTGGFLPRKIAGRPCEEKIVLPGDRICMVGGRIGKDGIHGATFSSLALDESSPMSAVQLGDPITQKRTADFLLEARDLGLYRALTDNGAGGLSSSVGEMSGLCGKRGGARMDVNRAQVKYPGLKPYELVVSESQERMTIAVPPADLAEFQQLAARRGVEVSDLGEFTDSGLFEIFAGDRQVAALDLEFLHGGAPRMKIQAEWKGRPSVPKPLTLAMGGSGFAEQGAITLLRLLSRPNIASKEWLIRQYDHEVQGTSVVKPLHLAQPGTPEAMSGPNDAGVIKPKASSERGIAVGCGLNPKLSDIDPYLMAQASVDEAVRNLICVGAEYGDRDDVMSLCDNFCWPDPVSDPEKAAALVRACFGLREACLELGIPLVSGKDSMKNDFRGKRDGQPVQISVPPTLLMTAVGCVPDVRLARTADFKQPEDVIYLIGGDTLGLHGSECEAIGMIRGEMNLGEPDWNLARKIYSGLSRELAASHRIRSVHDISEGGALVAIAEGLIARGLGAHLEFPEASEGSEDLKSEDPWELGFGEGFHSFIVSMGEKDALPLEEEWKKQGIPFRRLGTVTGVGLLRVEAQGKSWQLPVTDLRKAWKGGHA